jgi:threonine aldolase
VTRWDGKEAGMDFRSDNTAGVSPAILAAIASANAGRVGSYGADPWSERLTERVSAIFGRACAVFPVATGTAANSLALATLVSPAGAVLCAEEAHVAADEAGAPEFFTGGAKLIELPSADGRIRPAQIEAAVARARTGGVHRVQPDAVSVTQSTEWGVVYAPEELAAIGAACRAQGLALHMDGARFANAVAGLGCDPAELTWRAGVDVLSLGATKDGALAAEAVVFFDPERAAGFERRRKRAGHLLSKLRFVSAQLLAWLEDGLWLANAAQANRMAARLADGLRALPGTRLLLEPAANEVFLAAPESVVARLEAAGALFYRWIAPEGEARPVIRLVTSFATTEAEVDAFLAAARGLARAA